MAGLIGNPENVQLPPANHVKRVVLTSVVGTQPFYFDTKKPIFEIVKAFCETHLIKDYVKYSFKITDTGKYITEKSKQSITDGQFITLCESSLTIANHLIFELRKDAVQSETLVQVLQLLKADEEFAQHFVSQSGAKDLNTIITASKEANKAVSLLTSNALQCLVQLTKTVDCRKFSDLSVIGTVCSEVQKNWKNLETGSFTAAYIAASFQLLSAYLEKNDTDVCANFPENIHFVATTYLVPSCCPEIIWSVMQFLNQFLESHADQLVLLLNGKPPSCVNLRKAIADVLPVISTSSDVSFQGKALLQKIMGKEASDWKTMASDVAKCEQKISERISNLNVLLGKLAGYERSDPRNFPLEKVIGLDAILPAIGKSHAQIIPTLMSLSVLEYLLNNSSELFASLKLYNLEVGENQKVPLGLLTSEVCRYVYDKHFAASTQTACCIRVVFCTGTDVVDESSYDTLFAKLIDLAVSTWKLMEGGKTPLNRVLVVIRQQIDMVFLEKLRSASEIAFDEVVQKFSYNHMRHIWLQQQVEGFEKIKNGDVGRQLEAIFEPHAFALVKKQRLAVLALGKSFTKIPKSQPPEWPCRYFRLSANGTELSYQDLEESAGGVAPISLQYSIAASHIKDIMEGEQLAQLLRPPKNVDLATVFGMHRFIPKETESESTDRDEKSFFQAPDARTCVLWKDGLRLFINPTIPKHNLSKDFRMEVDTVVQIEVLARLSEIVDFSKQPVLPSNFYRPPDDKF